MSFWEIVGYVYLGGFPLTLMFLFYIERKHNLRNKKKSGDDDLLAICGGSFTWPIFLPILAIVIGGEWLKDVLNKGIE